MEFFANIQVLLLLFFSACSFVRGSWWLLSRVQLSAIASQSGPRQLCAALPGLSRRQREICDRQPALVKSIGQGARLGVLECQNQFRHHRWNCSTVDTGASVFGNTVLKVGSRESAFLYAISSAGVAHSVTRSCSRGELRHCTCDPNRKGVGGDRQGPFAWGGCSEFVSFGIKAARKFIDAREAALKDARSLMNLHNNRAGRKAVQRHTKKECKCHGVSGSCVSRTCWLALSEFDRVGHFLKGQYDGAVQVTVDQQGRLVSAPDRKPYSKADLVYYEPSPDYCTVDKTAGTLGTAGRECKKNSPGTDGCDLMCCGRGFDTKRMEIITKCRCKFHWCCYVQCDECRQWKDVHTCKSQNGS
ncbi:protein Wnt-2b-like [Uloborus diversus]|uniref:protein Wnt-2b-like n=1 Tax=Uloborus diversus TaxID=327109 RepID=UPI00240A384D|nr:protein Wnt-2b-like [Uloborus diversus]XP_054708001.1 protein Wnt-2b-like [Uloborus diversus]